MIFKLSTKWYLDDFDGIVRREVDERVDRIAGSALDGVPTIRVVCRVVGIWVGGVVG